MFVNRKVVKTIKFIVKKLNENYYGWFKECFCHYFIKETKANLTKEYIIEKIVDAEISKGIKEGWCLIDLVICDDMPVGFIIYQIDSEKSDWNERPGEGFVREFYISEAFRRKGLGSFLLDHVERVLKEMNAKEVYLTSSKDEVSRKFYIKNGYKNENKFNNYNKLEYFSKKL